MRNSIEELVDAYESGHITRRQLVIRLGVLVAMMGGVGRVLGDVQQEGRQKAESSTFKATEIDHIALRVTDIPRSRDFYVKHLGLIVSRESEQSCFLDCGDNFLALFHADEPRMDHYCYAIQDYDVEAAEEKLKAIGITPRVRGNRIYFNDPDDFTVQLAAEAHGS